MIAVWVMLFMLGNVVHTEYFKGVIQYRITESEFNKVASVLQSTYAYNANVEASNPKVIQNNLVYELEELQRRFNGEDVYLKIADDEKVDAVVIFSSVQLTGIISSNDGDVIGNERFNVTLKNITLTSQNYLGRTFSTENHKTLHFDFTNCSADIKTISASVESVQNIISQITEDNQKKLFQHALCHAYAIQFNLRFGASGVSLRIFQRPLLISTETCGLEIRNKTFMITQEVTTTTNDDTLLPNCPADNILPFPSLDTTSQPFEIVLHVDVFKSLFKDFKEQLGIGDKKKTVGDILPNLKDASELDTEGLYMMLLFPRVKDTYPDAVGRMVVLDVDIYVKATDGSLQLHFDITSNMLIALNCDKNMTYSAFNFTMNLVLPVQVGYNNRDLTFKLLGFSGNFTVLNSTVGHIIDRATRGLLYAIPSYTISKFAEVNNKIKGIPLTDILPEGVFATVKSLSVEKDSVVVGGGLTLVDPQLPLRKRSEIPWVGKSVSTDDFYLLGVDRTPEDLKPEEEKNCKEPEIISSASFKMYPTVLLCIMSTIVYFC